MRVILLVLTCFGGNPHSSVAGNSIEFPPLFANKEARYDLAFVRTESSSAKAQESAPVEGMYHVDAMARSIRVVTRRFFLRNEDVPHQREVILSRHDNGLLQVSTNETAPFRVTFLGDAESDSDVYSGVHGVNVVNGYFWTVSGSVWDMLRAHSGELIAGESSSVPGIDVTLGKIGDAWRLSHIAIRRESGESGEPLYAPKFYRIKPPAKPPIKSIEELECMYGPEDRTQNYKHTLTLDYGGQQNVEVQVAISVTNYADTVVDAPPVSDDGVYHPTIVTIPEGTHVGVVGSDIDYEWRDGRLVKSIDRVAVGVGQSARFQNRPRWFLVFIIAVLAMIALAVAVRELRRRRPAP